MLGGRECLPVLGKLFCQPQFVPTTMNQKKVTYDLERQMKGATLLKCSEFGDALVQNM